MQAPVIHIQLDEDGIPRTINRRVKVNMIALKHTNGESAEAIAEHYGITVADVYGALTYFHDNRAYFEERRQKSEELLEQYGVDGAVFRAEVEERLKKIRGD
jgi:uncharacterized protein (DUF433 family)